MKACSYTRVSTLKQEEDGWSLQAQAERNHREIERRGWELHHTFEDVVSTGEPIHRRRQLTEALEALDAGAYDVLVVARLDRLCRSRLEFEQLLQRSNQFGWKLLMLDPMVDTTTPYGEAMAAIAATFAQLERALIGQRTKEALAHLRAQGLPTGGAPGFDHQPTIDLIRTLKADGLSGYKIAEHLNTEGIRAAKGGRWYQSTVHKALKRYERRKAAC